jgi:hypothetical protein
MIALFTDSVSYQHYVAGMALDKDAFRLGALVPRAMFP